MTIHADAGHAASHARSAFETNKQVLFDVLDAQGIAVVTVTFDGYADEGQIQSIDIDGAVDAVPEVTISYLYPSTVAAAPTEKPLQDVLEAIVFDCLADTHQYWEDGEGAYGEVVFDAPTRSIHLDFNERFVDSDNYTHDF